MMNTLNMLNRYFDTSRQQKIKSLLNKKNSESLIGYINADQAADKNDHKSISEFVYKVFGNTINQSSRKQLTVSLLSTKAEYIALTNGKLFVKVNGFVIYYEN